MGTHKDSLFEDLVLPCHFFFLLLLSRMKLAPQISTNVILKKLLSKKSYFAAMVGAAPEIHQLADRIVPGCYQFHQPAHLLPSMCNITEIIYILLYLEKLKFLLIDSGEKVKFYLLFLVRKGFF